MKSFIHLFSSSADSRRVVFSTKHEVLVKGLVKLTKEKVWLGGLIIST